MAIPGFAVLRRASHGPAETPGLRGVACLAAGLASERVAAVGGVFDPEVLSPRDVAARKDKVSIVTVAGVGAQERGAQPRCSLDSAETNAVGAFRLMAHDHAVAFDMVQATGVTPDQETTAVDDTGDGVKAFCGRGVAPLVVQGAGMDREPFVVDPDVGTGVWGKTLAENQDPCSEEVRGEGASVRSNGSWSA